MNQAEIDILAGEVGLPPVALPSMGGKTKEKIERQQRKTARPIDAGRGSRNKTSKTSKPQGSAVAERPSEMGRKPVSKGRTSPGIAPRRGPSGGGTGKGGRR